MKNVGKITTLDEFIFEHEKDFSYASGELSGLLRDIGLAAKIVNREVNKAGLVDILGSMGINNATGDDVKKLDVFANEQFTSSLNSGGECCGIASEENEDIIVFENSVSRNAKYVVAIDPSGRLIQYRCKCFYRHHLFNLPARNIFRRMYTGRFFTKRIQAGGCGLYYLWFINHAGLHHRQWGERLYA